MIETVRIAIWNIWFFGSTQRVTGDSGSSGVELASVTALTAVTAVTRAEDVRLAADQQQLRGQRHGQGGRCGNLEQTASFSEFHRNTWHNNLYNYTHQIGQYAAYGT